MDHNLHSEEIAKLGKLIKDIKFAMLTTTDRDGSLRSRPMAVLRHQFDGTLWFFTNSSTAKVHEVDHHSKVNINMSNPEDQTYISISGRAKLVRDKKKAEEFWRPIYKAWFKNGLEDPDLCLLKVVVDSAEYWDAPSSPVAYLFGYLKNKLFRRHGEISAHQILDLRH